MKVPYAGSRQRALLVRATTPNRLHPATRCGTMVGGLTTRDGLAYYSEATEHREVLPLRLGGQVNEVPG